MTDPLLGLTDWTLKQRKSYAVWVLVVAVGLGLIMLLMMTDFHLPPANFLLDQRLRTMFLCGLWVGGGLTSGVHIFAHYPALRSGFRYSFMFFYCLLAIVGMLTVVPYYIYDLIQLIKLTRQQRPSKQDHAPRRNKVSSRKKSEDRDPWD